jgi:hypothetical protein
MAGYLNIGQDQLVALGQLLAVDGDDDDDDMGGDADWFGGPSLKNRALGALRKAAGGMGGIALNAGSRVARNAMAQAIAARKIAEGGIVQNESGKWRKLPLGIDSGAVAIAAAGTQQVTTRPQAYYKPTRLVVSLAIMSNFVIRDIKVGNVSQLVNASSLPADMFGPNSFDVELKGDTCQAGFDIVVDVENITLAASRFRGGFIGAALLPG